MGEMTPLEMAHSEAVRANERCDQLDKELESIRKDIKRMAKAASRRVNSMSVYS